MRDSLKPKSSLSPDDLIIQKMQAATITPILKPEPEPEPQTVGKHRLNLALPAPLFDELRAESDRKGLTVTAYLITLINKALGKD